MQTRIPFSKKIGALIYEVRILLWETWRPYNKDSSPGWVYVRNRKEKLISSKESLGVKCDWDLTSRLHINLIFPLLGKRLFRKAFNDFPIKFSTPGFKKSLQSKISFIIGHRGDQRLPLLLTVLKSIAAQQGCEIECVVVEQDSQERIKEFLPDWVTYVHSPQSKENMPYSRSGAFNVGAEFAKSDFFIFHDNDILVPEVYAREMWNSYQAGFEVVNLKRFIFFLDEKATQKVCVTKNFDEIPDIQYIMQNSEAGGSVGISADAFNKIGGFDERFIGWGGEDNELWQRAKTRKVNPFGFLPMIHLWHSPQPDKRSAQKRRIRKIQIHSRPICRTKN